MRCVIKPCRKVGRPKSGGVIGRYVNWIWFTLNLSFNYRIDEEDDDPYHGSVGSLPTIISRPRLTCGSVRPCGRRRGHAVLTVDCSMKAHATPPPIIKQPVEEPDSYMFHPPLQNNCSTFLALRITKSMGLIAWKTKIDEKTRPS